MPLPYPDNLTPDEPPFIAVQINEYWYSMVWGFLALALDRSFWSVTDEQWIAVEQAIYSAMDLPFSIGGVMQMVIGSYTGGGAASQSITDVGFQPDIVLLFMQHNTDTNRGLAIRSSADSATLLIELDGDVSYENYQIQSLDADGFTVNSSASGGSAFRGNKSPRNYTYVALKA